MGWGFSPSEATEIRAIASFHHPGGVLIGYVRMVLHCSVNLKTL
jgi:hypothetical protein